MSVTLIENPDYHKANGVSALAAKENFTTHSCYDVGSHFRAKNGTSAIAATAREDDEVILAVDRNVDRVFDLETRRR